MSPWDDDIYYTDQPIDDEDWEDLGIRDLTSEEAWLQRFGDDEDTADIQWDVVKAEPVQATPKWNSNPDNVINAPNEVRALYERCNKDFWSVNRNKSFYEQAILMADYTDDIAEIRPFSKRMPTYSDMNVAQMRSYFALRTLLRRGQYPEMPLSYLYVYIYETLMLIGVGTPEDGLDILKDLLENYKYQSTELTTALYTWMKDYVVYYNLKEAAKVYFKDEKEHDIRYLALSNHSKISDEALFEIMLQISTFDLRNGVLFKKHPKETVTVVARVFRAIAPILEAKNNKRIEEMCLGVKNEIFYHMFEGAIFYQQFKRSDYEFVISPCRKYHCKNGLWKKEEFKNMYYNLGIKELDNIIHEADRQLRLALKSGYNTKSRLHDRTLVTEISQVVEKFMKERAEARRQNVKVDFSQLERIREDAAAVRQALLTEEDKADNPNFGDSEHAETVSSSATNVETEPVPTLSPEPAESHSAPTPSVVDTDSGESALFNDDEIQFLRLLLSGGDWKTFLRQAHIPLGVMTERINEKMMEVTGDIVLEDDGVDVAIIEDYIEDIKAKIKD